MTDTPASPADLQTLLDHLPSIVLRVDAHNRYFNVRSPNSLFYIPGIDGHTPPEYFAQLAPYVTPGGDSVARAIAAFERARTTGEPQSFENILHYGAHTTYQLANVVPLPNGDLLVQFTDITAQKQTELALRDSERRHHLVNEIISETIYHFRYLTSAEDGFNLELHLYDDSFTTLTGYTVEDIRALNNNFANFTHPDDAPIVQQRRHALRSGKIHISEFRLRRKDGQYIWVRDYVRGLLDPTTGRVAEAFGALQDITTQKEAELALRDSYRARDIITSIISEYIYRLDYHYDEHGEPHATLHWYNNKLFELTGFTAEELRANQGDILRITHPDDHPRLLERRARFERGETDIAEFRIIRKDGQIIWVRDYVRGFLDPATGRITQAFAAIQNITTQKQAEAALRESERRHQILVNIVSDVVYHLHFTYDEDGTEHATLDWYSDRLTDLTGYSAEELAAFNGSILPITHPDDAPILLDRRARLEAATTHVCEFRLRNKNGATVWVRDYVRSVLNPTTGQLVEAYGAMQDITAEKTAQLTLAENEARYRQLAELTADYTYEVVFQPDGTFFFTFLSPSFERITGYTPAEVTASGKYTLYYTHPDDAHIIINRRKHVFAGETLAVEYRIIRKDGQVAWLHDQARPRFDAAGNVIGAIGAARDITTRKLAELALRDSERRNQLISQMTSDFAYQLVVETDDNDNLRRVQLVWASERLETVTGYTFDEFNTIAGDIFKFTHPDDHPILTSRRQQTLAGSQFTSEFRLIKKSGEIIWVSDTIRGVRDPATHRVRELYGAMRDITAQKQVELALRDSEERYRTLAELTSDFAYSIDFYDDGTYQLQWVTDAYTRVTGYPANTARRLISAGLREISPPKDHPILDQRHAAVLAGAPYHTCEFRLVTADWKTIWVRDHIHVQLDPVTGKPRRAYGAMQNITDHKAFETVLRASEERYRLITELASDFAYYVSVAPTTRTFSFDWVTHPAERLLGYTIAELQAMSNDLATLIHPDDLPLAQQTLNLIFSGQHTTTEFRIFPRNGSPRWLRAVNRPIFAADNTTVIAFVGSAQDITEQKIAELALRRSEERHRYLSEIISDYAFRVLFLPDGSHITDWVTGAHDRILSYTPEEIAELGGIIGITHPDDHAVILNRRDRVRQGEPVISEFRIIRKDGEIRWLRDYLRPITDPGSSDVVLAYGAAQDITDIRRAQQQIETFLDRQIAINDLALTLGASNDLTFIYSHLYHTVSRLLNIHTFDIQRYLPHENLITTAYFVEDGQVHPALGQRFVHPTSPQLSDRAIFTRQPQHFTAPNQLDRLYAPLLLSDQVIGLLRVIAKPGVSFTPDDATLLSAIASVAAIAIRNAQLLAELQTSNLSLAEQVDHRTTELRMANARLARAARAKDEFLANMTHELRTPLSAILGLTEALQENLPPTPDPWQARTLATIEASGRHLLNIINDLLEVSKIEAGKLTLQYDLIDLTSLCESALEVVRPAAEEKSLCLTHQPAPDFDRTHPIYTDQRRLLQILINLLSNAVKFTPAGGTVTLSLSGSYNSGKFTVTVTDTGIGIDPADLPRLFRPFEQADSTLTRAYQGTGLGLALVASLTELHGGSVRVDSTPNHGSQFHVTLPWRTTPPHPASEDPTTPAFDQYALAIINDLTDVTPLRHAANALHLRLTHTYDVQEGLQIASHMPLGLIFIDLRLLTLDGLYVLQALRAMPNHYNTPILMLQSLVLPDQQAQLTAAGATACLPQPVTAADIHAALNG